MGTAPTIIIDMSAIRRGGGVQLACNFLDRYRTSSFRQFRPVILLPGDGLLADWESPDGLAVVEVLRAPTRAAKRWVFYRTRLQKLIRHHNIKASFTFFGPGLPCPGSVISVVSVAYPIICYPESPFWKYCPRSKAWPTKFRNVFRRNAIRQASVVLAETETMKGRLVQHLRLSPKKVSVLPPVVSSYIPDVEKVPETCQSILVLSGLAPHKNLWRLYDVAYLANEKGLDIRFLVSVDREAFITAQRNTYPLVLEVINRRFEFVGSVPPRRIGDMYERSDALLNISDLESFSNNYMEAWTASSLLICSDRDFARHICQDSAIYVEPHDAESVVDGIERLLAMTLDEREAMVRAGKRLLHQLPNFTERFDIIADQIIELIQAKDTISL
ncbi:MAG: glycosyltransferase [Actinobacteria bacterium]|nr:glycosyltransferase [Actinomycetota bacterium]